MEHATRTYLPAAGHDWALPLYDPLVKLLGGDMARRTLLAQAALRPDHRVLDVGCGTGTLAVLIKRLHPGVEVTGLDPDPKALARAARKAQHAGVPVRFEQGSADALPYAGASFDRVFSSYMFHHLRADQREAALREIRRVLKPGACLHLLDFERQDAPAGWLARHINFNHHFECNSEEHIVALLRQAGFASPRRVQRGAMLFGLLPMGYYEASAPA